MIVRHLVAILFACVLLFVGRVARAGYTHTWTWKQKPDDGEVARCIGDIQKMILRRPDVVVVLSPQVPGELRLNGRGESAQDDFVFPGKVGTNVVSTEREPYDEIVTAALLVARDHFPPEVLEIKSEGTWLQWQDGILLYTETFTRAPKNPGIHEAPGFRPGGRFEMPDGMPRDRWSNPKTRPWGIVIALCFVGLIVLLLVPTKQK